MGAAAAAAAGAGAFSNLFSGLAAQGQSATTQAENYALEKRQQADAEAQLANTMSRQSQTNPLRDQTIYNLANTLGTSPAAFNPVNFGAPTNTGQQGSGSYNLNGLANANANYTPGAGGVTSNIPQMIMNRLGYGNVGTGTLYDNPTTPPDLLSNAPTAASTTGATAIGGQGVPGGNNAGANPGITAGGIKGSTGQDQLAPAMQQAVQNAPPPAASTKTSVAPAGTTPSVPTPGIAGSMGLQSAVPGSTAGSATDPATQIKQRALLQSLMGGGGAGGGMAGLMGSLGTS